MRGKEAKIFDAVTPLGNPTTKSALEAHRAAIRRESGNAQWKWMLETDNGHRLPAGPTLKVGETILLSERKPPFGRRRP